VWRWRHARLLSVGQPTAHLHDGGGRALTHLGGDLLTPTFPGKETAEGCHKARQARTDDRAGNGADVHVIQTDVRSAVGYFAESNGVGGPVRDEVVGITNPRGRLVGGRSTAVSDKRIVLDVPSVVSVMRTVTGAARPLLAL
jgi:hypothetical protein